MRHLSAPTCFAAIAASVLLALSGCATGPSAEITRFNIGQPIPKDSIRIEPASPEDGRSLEFAALAASVQQELTAIGFPAADSPGRAAYIAVLGAEQASREGPPRGPSLTVGIGGGSFGRGGGVSGGVALPVGQARPSELRQTMVSLRIRRASDATVVWEGRAVEDLPGNASAAALTSAVPRLARALLADFPGQNGQTIRVKTR